MQHEKKLIPITSKNFIGIDSDRDLIRRVAQILSTHEGLGMALHRYPRTSLDDLLAVAGVLNNPKKIIDPSTSSQDELRDFLLSRQNYLRKALNEISDNQTAKKLLEELGTLERQSIRPK